MTQSKKINFLIWGGLFFLFSTQVHSEGELSPSEVTVRVVMDDNSCCIKPERGIGGSIQFTPAQSGNVTLKVFTPSGEMVTQTTLQVIANVATQVGWDGKSIDGNKPAASGIYILHVEGAGINTTKKIAVIK